MVYVCEKCNFIFERVGEVESCPYCDAKGVQPADQAEEEAYCCKMKKSSCCSPEPRSGPARCPPK